MQTQALEFSGWGLTADASNIILNDDIYDATCVPSFRAFPILHQLYEGSLISCSDRVKQAKTFLVGQTFKNVRVYELLDHSVFLALGWGIRMKGVERVPSHRSLILLQGASDDQPTP